MRNAGLEEAQAGIKIAGRNINNLIYADDTTLMAESEEELKSLLMKVKVESENFGLKLNIQKTKIMASSPMTSWEIDGETVETVSDFIFLGSKITADGDYSHEIKRRLLLGRKVMTNLDSIFKSIDITLPTKVRLINAMVFPVIMYGCESWTVKKAERRRIDAFELWCWRRLESPLDWTPTSPFCRRSNQSILKEINPGISLEGMMLKLKLQYFGHLMLRVHSLEKTLMLGGIGGRRRRGRPRVRRLDASRTRWTWFWVNSGRWWWTGMPGVLWFMGSQSVGHDWVTELNWTDWFQVHDLYHEHEHYVNGLTGDSNSPLTSLTNIYKNFRSLYKSQIFISIYKRFHCNAFQIVYVFVLPLLIVHLHTPPLEFFFSCCLCGPLGRRALIFSCETLETQIRLWVGNIPWGKKWQPTPVFLPRDSHGQKSLVGYSPWGHRVGLNWACMCAEEPKKISYLSSLNISKIESI